MDENKQLEPVNKMLLDIIKNQKENDGKIFKLYMTTIICYTVVLVTLFIGFFVYESQFETVETVTTTTETITQEVSGNDSTINNVEGNQYNDSAIHNE